MHKIRDILRLRAGDMSRWRIAVSIGLGPTAVRAYLDRAEAAGLTWPLPEGLSDEDLERLLFPKAPDIPTNSAARLTTRT